MIICLSGSCTMLLNGHTTLNRGNAPTRDSTRWVWCILNERVASNACFQFLREFISSASKAKLIAQPFCHFACKEVGYINCIRWLLSIACFLLWRTVDIMLWHTFRFEEYMAASYRPSPCDMPPIQPVFPFLRAPLRIESWYAILFVILYS